MTRLPPISTRTDTLCPSTTLFRSDRDIIGLLGGQILYHIGKGAVGMLVNIAKPPERAQRRPEIRDLVADPSEQAHDLLHPPNWCFYAPHMFYARPTHRPSRKRRRT